MTSPNNGITRQTPPPLFGLLAHNLRWQLMKLLSEGDYRVNELVALLGQPLNLVSYHLKQLREGQLVAMRRSEADGRDNYYSLDLDCLRALYEQAGQMLHPSLVSTPSKDSPSTPNLRVLFVCTHNSARSQMAEGLLRHLSEGRITTLSAGSHPTTVHPLAIHTMQTLGIDIRHQTPRSFHEVIDQSFDVVVTVCDHAREVCPTFAGGERHLHWGYPDPASIRDEGERQQAFMKTAHYLQARIQHFLMNISTGEEH